MREYIWLQGRPIAAITDADTASPILYHVHVDQLDGPVLMTGIDHGVVWRASYRPFGEVQSITGQASLDLRFPGQWFMLEAGLNWNWRRWYDPSLGRYTQPDPLGMPDGPSRYAYALGSPVMLTDRMGAGVADPMSPQSKPNSGGGQCGCSIAYAPPGVSVAHTPQGDTKGDNPVPRGSRYNTDLPGGFPDAEAVLQGLSRLAGDQSIVTVPNPLRPDILMRSYPSGVQLRVGSDLMPRIDIPGNTFDLRTAETIHFTGGKGNMCPTN